MDALPVVPPPRRRDSIETLLAIITVVVIFGLFAATLLYATGHVG